MKSPAGVELNPKEIAMAKALVDSLSAPFEPKKYADTYQDAERAMIERKVQKLPTKKPAPAPRTKGEVIDLLAVLQQSLRETLGTATEQFPGNRRRAAVQRHAGARHELTGRGRHAGNDLRRRDHRAGTINKSNTDIGFLDGSEGGLGRRARS